MCREAGHDAHGNVNVELERVDFTLTGHGVMAYIYNGIKFNQFLEPGNKIITIDVTDSTIIGQAANHYGLYGVHGGQGAIDIDVTNSSVTANSVGIFARHRGDLAGSVAADDNLNVDITLNNSTVTSTVAHGIWISREFSTSEGRDNIRVGPNSSVIVSADGAHGILAGIPATGAASTGVDTVVTVDGTVTAPGAGAVGVYLGALTNGTVNVNGTVTGGSGADGTDGYLDGAGIRFDAGGTVNIGPQGTVSADSQVAILAAGELTVHMRPGGRKIAELFPGDGWIINDGGGTNLLVNNTLLHDSVSGNTGRTAANGVWNVSISDADVRNVDMRAPLQTNWVTYGWSGVANRDFRAADFDETRRPTPPPVEPTDPMVMPEPDPMMPPIVSEMYGPRAAVYEALPDMLLRMQASRMRPPHMPDTSSWIRYTDGSVDQEFDRSTTGTEYDMDQEAMEIGVSIPVSDSIQAWASLHSVRGSADVSSL